MSKFDLFLIVAIVVMAAYLWQLLRPKPIPAPAQLQRVTIPDFAATQLGNKRTLTLFLPPHYDSTHPYPLLLLQDGQDVAQLQLEATLTRLWAAGQIAPLIVVAIPTNSDRLQEYGTAVTLNAQGLGGKAAAYTNFITVDLLPWLRQNYPISEDPTDIAILGASLGGLSAFDIAWHHPDIFGKVGVLSGSFWWRAGAQERHILPHELIVPAMIRQTEVPPPLEMWFEVGTHDEKDDRDGNGVIDAVQDTLEVMATLAEQGYIYGRDMHLVQILEGEHNYPTWSQILPQFLQWGFPPS